MPYQKGQSGNPSGSRVRQQFRDAIQAALAKDGDPRKRLRNVAEKLIRAAESGDQAAIKELADRIDGKPPQALQVGGELGGAIQVVISKDEDAL